MAEPADQQLHSEGYLKALDRLEANAVLFEPFDKQELLDTIERVRSGC